MVNNDLLTFIENEVKRGVSHEAIQEALAAAGWKALEVADAFRMVAERANPEKAGTPFTPMPISLGIPSDAAGVAPNTPIISSEVKITEETDQPAKPEHHRLLPVLIIFAAVVLLGAGYFFAQPLLNDPSKKIEAFVSTMETTKSIQYSGDYEITAPAGMLFSDKILAASFGGISARQTPSSIKATFAGVDDWFDFKSKKNEAKFTVKVKTPDGNTMDFSSTSRMISNALYVKLPESAALYNEAIANQGANWVRFEGDMTIPTYAYGFWGGASLYGRGFPRELAPLISQVTIGNTTKLPTGETVATVTYSNAVVTYFSNIFLMTDKLAESENIGTKYTLSALTELPTGEITINADGTIKKAIIVFGYKTKEFTLPVHVKFSISFDRFNLPPTINIPPLVVSYNDLVGKNAASDLPESLQGFFSDVRTIASVYKGVHENSYKGVCQKSGADTEEGTELTIPYVSAKVAASGYDAPVCYDTPTAWSFYTHSTMGYYCTDSRGFSGKATRQPLGDKCN